MRLFLASRRRVRLPKSQRVLWRNVVICRADVRSNLTPEILRPSQFFKRLSSLGEVTESPTCPCASWVEMCPISFGCDTLVVVGIPQGKLARSPAKVTVRPVHCSLCPYKTSFSAVLMFFKCVVSSQFGSSFHSCACTPQSSLCDTFTLGSRKKIVVISAVAEHHDQVLFF